MRSVSGGHFAAKGCLVSWQTSSVCWCLQTNAEKRKVCWSPQAQRGKQLASCFDDCFVFSSFLIQSDKRLLVWFFFYFSESLLTQTIWVLNWRLGERRHCLEAPDQASQARLNIKLRILYSSLKKKNPTNLMRAAPSPGSMEAAELRTNLPSGSKSKDNFHAAKHQP